MSEQEDNNIIDELKEVCNLADKIKNEEFILKVKEKLYNLPTIYVLQCKYTAHTYINESERSFDIYINKDDAQNKVNMLIDNGMSIEVVPITKNINFFISNSVHLLGIRNIHLYMPDNKGYLLDATVMEKGSKEATNSLNDPVINPEMIYAQLLLLQELRSKKMYENKEKRIRDLEDAFLNKVINARFLVPAKVEKTEDGKEKFEIVKLVNEKNEKSVPLYSDWFEFGKMFRAEDGYKGLISSFDDLKQFVTKEQFVILNPKGNSFKLDRAYLNKCVYRQDVQNDFVIVTKDGDNVNNSKDNLQNNSVVENHANKIFVPVLGGLQMQPSVPNSHVVFSAKGQNVMERFLAYGKIDGSFEEMLKKFEDDIRKEIENYEFKSELNKFVFFKELQTQYYKFKIYAYDWHFENQNKEQGVIRDFYAYFMDERYNEIYEIDLCSISPFKYPTETLNMEKIDVENDEVTASLVKMLEMVLKNVKPRE